MSDVLDRPAPPRPAAAAGADEDEIARARRIFAAQAPARRRLAKTDARARIARLRRLREVVLQHRDDLEAAVWEDFRKPGPEFEITELQVVLGELAHTIRRLPKWMRPRRVPTPVLLTGGRSRVHPEPRGRVLVLSPWNYPFQLAFAPLVAAVAAGNAVMLRPSEKTPAVNRVMARIVAGAFPEDEVAMVLGGVPVAEALLALPFDHFFFTGSTEVGRRVMHAAADHMASVTLELGGKSPAIVDRTADVDAAAERIVWGKFVNAGQTCVATDYVLVDASVAPAFLDAARATLARFYGSGSAVRESDHFARLIDRRAYDRLSAALDEAVSSGAVIEAGGERHAETLYIAPTIVSGVDPDGALMRDEIFGPVLPVLAVRGLDEAIDFVAHRPKPLALYLFSRSGDARTRVLEETSAGGTVMNHTICHLGNPDLPFGGVGESGMGAYHGHAGFRAFSHERSVLHMGRLHLTGLYYPPYGPRMRRVARLVTAWFARRG